MKLTDGTIRFAFVTGPQAQPLARLEGFTLPTRGLTVCVVQQADRQARGVAACSLKDTFDVGKGAKAALTAALRGWPKAQRAAVWEEVLPKLRDLRAEVPEAGPRYLPLPELFSKKYSWSKEHLMWIKNQDFSDCECLFCTKQRLHHTTDVR